MIPLRPRVVLICHARDRIDRVGLASWLAATMDLAGVICIHDDRWRPWRALAHERRRSGWLGVADVLLFRLYARLMLAARERQWIEQTVRALESRYQAPLDTIPRLDVSTPNCEAAAAFLDARQPDLVIARCKVLLAPDIFERARLGTFVLHPGICPEYRNAHGCFWALATRDLDRVGMTLLKVDRGIDTGPIYLQASTDVDERRESHAVIQYRVVLDNLDAIHRTLVSLWHDPAREPVSVAGRRSAVWGHPRLTAYVKWKWSARRDAARHPALS
jgi:folate-dependent phosphoribosylglycinamide formyltransferase PurN